MQSCSWASGLEEASWSAVWLSIAGCVLVSLGAICKPSCRRHLVAQGWFCTAAEEPKPLQAISPGSAAVGAVSLWAWRSRAFVSQIST